MLKMSLLKLKANHIIPLIKTQWGAHAVPDTQEAEAGRLFELKNSKSAWVTLKKQNHTKTPAKSVEWLYRASWNLHS